MMTQQNSKTEWDLTLLYDSLDDPRIEEDVQRMEAACEVFESKYRDRDDDLSDEHLLLEALNDRQHLEAEASGKPLYYAWYVRELNSASNEAKELINRLTERFTKASNRITFFELALGAIPPERQRVLLETETLEQYRYKLSRIFEAAKHNLSESEEKILALKSRPAKEMWISGFSGLLNKQSVAFGEENIPINEAISKSARLEAAEDRHTLWRGVTETLYAISDFAESEMNAVLTDKKINDELRGFSEPYDATILGYENNQESVLALVNAVTDQFALSKRFYELKKRLMGLDVFRYSDRAAPVGKLVQTYSFPQAAALVREALERAHPRYARMHDQYIANGQIDVYPRGNKSGGAFCSSNINMPTYILLNHTDDFDSVMTMAHEEGHGIHGERSKTQPVVYQSYSTAVAETASTFFEGLAFERAVEDLSAEERIIALHNKLFDEVSTIFRQIAFFNFELELHRTLRKDGWISKERIAELLNEHMASYMGPAVQLDEKDGYSFTYISHFRRPFYVYSYAYGQLISRALLKKMREDHAFIEKVDEFLSAGKSKSPEQIFGDIGVDVGPELFREGLAGISADLDEFERLIESK